MSHEDDVMKLMRIGFELLLKELNIEYRKLPEKDIDTESNFKSKLLHDGGNLSISSKNSNRSIEIREISKRFRSSILSRSINT